MKINTVNAHCVKVYNSDTNTCTIFSYDTPVFSCDSDGFHRLWSGYSATTLRDINTCIVGVRGKLTKKEWDAMPVKEA